MNTSTYTYLLANPEKIKKEDLPGLASVIEKYPYFQSARALQLKGLKNEKSFLYNDALKLTAAYTTDRDILFEYITSDQFVQNEISQAIQQHDAEILALDVVTEDVSEQVSVALDNQMKAELKKADDIFNPELFERKLASVKGLIETQKQDEQDSTKDELETSLDIEKPLEFKKTDTHSFGEWLKLTSATPIERTSEEDQLSTQERKFQLIEKFIQQKPKMKPSEIVSDQKDLSEPYTQSSEALMTETLAKVYLQQKNYSKAIQAYKILILKYPEKSGFFADQIRAIKKLTNTEEQ